MITPVILCGGSGTRLWPVSRKSLPKQFVPLIGELSLFQQAIQRCRGSHFAAPLILTSADYRFIVAQQLGEIGIVPASILLEPEGKNTAPAILAAASYLNNRDGDGNGDGAMLVMPSDHFIPDQLAFQEMVLRGNMAAQEDRILAFGVIPDRPETGYGYIERSRGAGDDDIADILAFHEKPDAKRAQVMLESGLYLWNAGIFMARCQTFIDSGREFMPIMMRQVERAVSAAKADLDFLRLDGESWADISGESVDYALMEKAQNISVMPFAGSWSDLGDWQSVQRALKDTAQATDENANAAKGNTIQIDTTNSLIWSENSDQVMVTIGVSDIIAVAMPDAVLIADAREAQSVKKAVQLLKENHLPQAELHARDYRPWGWFESLIRAEGYQVKRLHVYQGASLSLQSHKHRSEHWVVTDGLASVQLDDKKITLEVNQSIYIGAGCKHRLSNQTDRPLTIIEVQTGSYLGEDDIIRYEDDYQR